MWRKSFVSPSEKETTAPGIEVSQMSLDSHRPPIYINFLINFDSFITHLSLLFANFIFLMINETHWFISNFLLIILNFVILRYLIYFNLFDIYIKWCNLFHISTVFRFDYITKYHNGCRSYIKHHVKNWCFKINTFSLVLFMKPLS